MGKTVVNKGFTETTITKDELPLRMGMCGISENIKSQWKQRNKTLGCFDQEKYIFMSHEDYTTDHCAFIDSMKTKIKNPRILVSIDESGGKLTVHLHPAQTGIMPESEFEKAVIKEILQECKEALSARPNGTRFQVDIDLKSISMVDVKHTRATTIAEIEKQIALLEY